LIKIFPNKIGDGAGYLLLVELLIIFHFTKWLYTRTYHGQPGL
jgi:hypothetical protein